MAHRTRFVVIILALLIGSIVILSSGSVLAAGELIVNGGFETGDFSGWTKGYTGSSPYCSGWQINGGCMGLTAPAEGSKYAMSPIDGDGPNNFFLYQDVVIPAASSVSFTFKYSANISNFGSQPRVFEAQVRDPGTDSVLETVHTFTAPNGATTNTGGYVTVNADLSAYACNTVRIYFDMFVPENYTGPAQLNIDAVSMVAGGSEACGEVVTTPVVVRPPDHRLNWQDGDLEAVVYPANDDNGNPSLHVYCVNETSQGYIAMVITEADLVDFP
ncbi:MAG: hypothetical protein JNJ61_17100, partial [Anaerolineae bacterium]|nr:hypothetical protein [Anaerolineae bacterium]